MSVTQTNCESTIVATNKPAETFACPNETATTSNTQVKPKRAYVPDRGRIARRNFLATEKYRDEHVSNQKKQRYWNSWEELYIVELWRRYRDEVTVINVPLPVYRKMVVAMRNLNMIVNAQDCRRKINTLNAKYKLELNRVENTGCKSDWKLFPLIHCVLQPKIKEYDPWHESKIVRKLLDKLPKSVHELTSPAVELSRPVKELHKPVKELHKPVMTFISPQSPVIKVNKSYLQPLDDLVCSTLGQFDKPSILPFRNITIQKIEMLRQDNIRLAAQYDADLKRLQMEEDNFRCFETFIRIWTEQKELELSRVKSLTQQNVVTLENGENRNMEENLQEAVVAK